MSGPAHIVIVAGELSGDIHASRILRALRQQHPEIQAWGFGGDHLAGEGMQIREHIRDLSVMGFVEVLKRYGYFRRIFHQLLNEIRSRKPDLILLVDYPGFNLRLAEALRGSGIPIVQYVCPQVWAWKAGRIPRMARCLDRLICIFPFEPPLFAHTGLDARYSGHPLVDETAEVVAEPHWQGSPRLALVPGSRRQEIERLFIPMMEAAHVLRGEFPTLALRVPAADAGLAQRMRELLATRPDLHPPDIVDGHMRELVKGADAALVTSGTATFEAALLGTPMVIVYKTSPMTYAIGKRLIRIPWIGMVNIIAGREICPELIQENAEPNAMADALRPLLTETPVRAKMLEGMLDVRSKLVSDEQGMAPASLVWELLERSK